MAEDNRQDKHQMPNKLDESDSIQWGLRTPIPMGPPPQRLSLVAPAIPMGPPSQRSLLVDLALPMRSPPQCWLLVALAIPVGPPPQRSLWVAPALPMGPSPQRLLLVAPALLMGPPPQRLLLVAPALLMGPPSQHSLLVALALPMRSPPQCWLLVAPATPMGPPLQRSLLVALALPMAPPSQHSLLVALALLMGLPPQCLLLVAPAPLLYLPYRTTPPQQINERENAGMGTIIRMTGRKGTDQQKQLVNCKNILNYFMNIKDKTNYKYKMQTARKIQRILKKIVKRYHFIFLTGSTWAGLAERISNINICIIAPAVDNSVETEIRLLKKVGDVIEDNSKCVINLYQKLNRSTEKPTLRFIWWGEGDTPEEIVVTINDYQSLNNSQLNCMYSKCDWRFQPLYCLTKKWFRGNEFSGLEESLFSNYSISLLLINFLQNVFPSPVLPKLPEKVISGRKRVKPLKKIKLLSSKWSSSNDMKLDELFVDFFKYYGTFDWKRKRVSIRETDHVEKNDNGCIYIEDPFTHNNTTSYFNCDGDLNRLRRAISGMTKISCQNFISGLEID